MKILHVNNVDLLGSRFNGYDMQRALNARGITADQIVMERMGSDPHTRLLSTHLGGGCLRSRWHRTKGINPCDDLPLFA